ncbi:MAG: DNA primase catalytic subunit PriS [Candidatus Thermoplasmatota archaeon]|nr:DNA primase catalytic subunit PriS [Candidatus Thermoplasmatota archaeon]
MQSLSYLKQKFYDYYKNAILEYPLRFGRREFGFMFFESELMQRHLSFSTREELKNFIIERVPSHVYYSAAYYNAPSATEMVKKGWLGADLIFDLDGDKLQKAKNLDYKEMLEVVKRETLKLIESFLISDFGFDSKFITVNFSGARGYHVHVVEPKILALDSYARREILDYLTAEGLDWNKRIFHEEVYMIVRSGFRKIAKKTIKMPCASAGGWEGKVGRGLLKFVENLEDSSAEEAIAKLQSYGIKKKTAVSIYKELFEKVSGVRGVDKVKEGRLDIFSKDSYLNAFLDIINKELRVDLTSGTDEPVTSDTKRLIRMQSSLHGKTGFKAVSLTIDELKDFEPLRDAVAFSDLPTKIKVLGDVKFELGGEKFNLTEGLTVLPEYAAVFLIARGAAEKI